MLPPFTSGGIIQLTEFPSRAVAYDFLLTLKLSDVFHSLVSLEQLIALEIKFKICGAIY